MAGDATGRLRGQSLQLRADRGAGLSAALVLMERLSSVYMHTCIFNENQPAFHLALSQLEKIEKGAFIHSVRSLFTLHQI